MYISGINNLQYWILLLSLLLHVFSMRIVHPRKYNTLFNALDFRIKSLREFAILMCRTGAAFLSKRKAVQRAQTLNQSTDASKVLSGRKNCRPDTKIFQASH